MRETNKAFRPRGAGEGDHAKRGGGGFGMEACSSVNTCPYRLASLATFPAIGGGKRPVP